MTDTAAGRVWMTPRWASGPDLPVEWLRHRDTQTTSQTVGHAFLVHDLKVTCAVAVLRAGWRPSGGRRWRPQRWEDMWKGEEGLPVAKAPAQCGLCLVSLPPSLRSLPSPVASQARSGVCSFDVESKTAVMNCILPKCRVAASFHPGGTEYGVKVSLF